MSMFTGGVTNCLRDVRRADETAARIGRQLTTGKKLNAPADGPFPWLAAGRAGTASSALHTIHTALNQVGTTIRVADQSMAAIGKDLQVMQSHLEQAQLYPLGNPARDVLIADYNTLREQIDELVNTTSPEGARKLVAGEDMEVLVGLNGGRKTVHGQLVGTGPLGLNLPLLDSAADLSAAAAQIKNAQAVLSARRQGLAADLADITRYDDQGLAIAGFYDSHAESLAAADSEEDAATLQAVAVQRSLSVEALNSISSVRSGLLELLK
jgi:flagellin-like hook-associated protein FlgL